MLVGGQDNVLSMVLGRREGAGIALELARISGEDRRESWDRHPLAGRPDWSAVWLAWWPLGLLILHSCIRLKLDPPRGQNYEVEEGPEIPLGGKPGAWVNGSPTWKHFNPLRFNFPTFTKENTNTSLPPYLWGPL